MRIAYVEDNEPNMALVRRVARLGDHQVLGYDNAEEAFQALVSDLPDLILVDIELGGGESGLQLTSRLRQAGVEIPIIAVTAFAMMGDREKSLEAGVTDYIPKPLPVSQLVELFRHYGEVAEAAEVVEVTEVVEVAEPVNN
ncbi:MAG: response regulator [Anaerolineae bacterium]|nr:response regulator [Anaerolineae bacterium]